MIKQCNAMQGPESSSDLQGGAHKSSWHSKSLYERVLEVE